MPTLLTKSKYVIGLQCPKYLWMMFHEPSKIPETDAATQFLFDQGHEVGNLAKKWFKGGIDIPSEDFMGNIRLTKELLKKKRILFEPGFMKDNIYSRIDILRPVKNNQWDIIEVKASTQVKDEHYHDVSFQKYCCERAGLRIRRCFLMHINNEYVREGEIDPESVLIQEDITDEVEKASKGIKERISLMFDIISSKTSPKTDISKQCDEPYECPLKDDCWKFLPEYNIFHLYRGGQKAFDLFTEGIETIGDIPDNTELSDKQELQRDCERTGKTHIHKEKIKHFLKTLHPPLYYLDFETFSFAIPKYDGTKPYQNIPFQFSLHVVQSDGKTQHFSFIADGKGDPRETFAEELKKVIGDKGTVVTYNQSFEISRLKELADAFPKHKKWIDDVISRVVDLLIPFREFAYYNPKQKGSASIKKVLPALTGKSYDNMEIANGGVASLSFIKILTGNASKEEEKKIRKDLEDYCGLDTEGMIWIVDKLKEIVK